MMNDLLDTEPDIDPDFFEDDWDEGPCCSICDGLGHGYPGGPPCPIESPDPDDYAYELSQGR